MANKLVATIPWLSNEWIISLILRLENRAPAGINCNIFSFDKDEENGVPALFIDKVQQQPFISYVNTVNGQTWFKKFTAPQNNEDTHIEMHQRYVSNGNYRFFILVNGEEINSVINNNAQQYYNVKIYASSYKYYASACQGSIKYLKLTNFL